MPATNAAAYKSTSTIGGNSFLFQWASQSLIICGSYIRKNGKLGATACCWRIPRLWRRLRRGNTPEQIIKRWQQDLEQ